MIEDSASHSRLQIELAAQGAISGTLGEWPHLKRALRQRGIRLPDSTSAAVVRQVCAGIVEAME